jgi:hypothetical protein
MKHWRSKVLALGGVAALAAAIPAIGQNAQSPESLLPPGFGDPKALPPPVQPTTPTPAAPSAAPPSARPAAPAAPRSLEGLEGIIENASDEDLEALANLPPPIEIPDASRRPTDVVGVLERGNWGLGADAFAGANGRFLSTLMRRLDAPLPSRWNSMLLRRALLSRIPAPASVQPVDWVAERAWLLLRMGEADAARMLVQSIDVDQFTPKMFSVAVQTALATADPAALCPLIEPGRKTSDEPVWVLGDAICASLSGEAGRASSLIEQTRRRGRIGGIDLVLAEKVVGSGENTRRAVTVEWEPVDSINSWRFGLAAATGVEIPERLMSAASPHMRAWQARAPMLPVEQRVAAAYTAASLGVFSNASLVEMFSLIGDATDASEMSESMAGRLRQTYVARTGQARVAAMRALWEEAKNPTERHARSILTASAAARLAPNPAFGNDIPDLLASMLTAGYDQQATRWSGVVEGLDGQAGEVAWALLATASPDPAVEISAARVEAFRDGDESKDGHRTRLLFAALAGLDRLDAGARDQLAGDLGVRIGLSNGWTEMLERAVQGRQPGTVALLAAIGMQTGGWAGVPPEHLYQIVSALRRVGLGYEARMIAAEAVARG